MTTPRPSSIMLNAIEATLPGATCHVRAQSSSAADLAAFQWVVRDARQFQADGAILIVQEHQESQTANRFVDRLRFERLA